MIDFVDRERRRPRGAGRVREAARPTRAAARTRRRFDRIARRGRRWSARCVARRLAGRRRRRAARRRGGAARAAERAASTCTRSVEPDSRPVALRRRGRAQAADAATAARARSAKPVAAATGRWTSTPQVRPWIGDEAAIALLPDGRRASSLILVRVADQARARDFLRGAGRPARAAPQRESTVRSYGSLATAFVGDFLAIGSPANVRAAIDTRGGAVARRRLAVPLARCAGCETDDPIAYAYASQAASAGCCASRVAWSARVRRSVERPGPARRPRPACVREPNGLRRERREPADRLRRVQRAAVRAHPDRGDARPTRSPTSAPRGLDEIFDQLARGRRGRLGRARAGPRARLASAGARLLRAVRAAAGPRDGPGRDAAGDRCR